jgi:hypothetical protein
LRKVVVLRFPVGIGKPVVAASQVVRASKRRSGLPDKEARRAGIFPAMGGGAIFSAALFD